MPPKSTVFRHRVRVAAIGRWGLVMFLGALLVACGHELAQSRWADGYAQCGLPERSTVGMTRTAVNAEISFTGTRVTGSMWVPAGSGLAEPRSVPSVWVFGEGNVSAGVARAQYGIDTVFAAIPGTLCVDSIDRHPALIHSVYSSRPGHEGWTVQAWIDVDSVTDIRFFGVTYDSVDADQDKERLLRALATILVHR